MTVSVKFKAYVCLILILLINLSFLVHADIINLTSEMEEPVPVYEIDDNLIHIKIYWVQYTSNTYYLNEIDAHYPLNTHFAVQQNRMYCFDQQPVYGNWYTYDLATGALMTVTGSPNGIAQNTNTPSGLNTPYYFLWTVNYSGSSYYPDNANFSVVYLSQQYNITWAKVPPSVTLYRSYFSEPKQDEYNRYLIIGDGSSASLLWFSFQRFEYQYTNSGNPTNHIDGQLWSQTITISESGGIHYAMLFQTPSALDNLSYLQYVLMITQFNLETGQYITSSLYTGTEVSTNINVDLSAFVDPADITDLSIYGMNCIIADYLINRISVKWSFDPTFESWKESVTTYLLLIYQSLSQTAEEVTIAQDESGYDEMQSAVNDLKVTDSNGNTVNAADQASVAFSQADAGIQDLAEPIGFINDNIVSNVFFEPILVVPVVVALALGLLITILGKNKSD